MLRKIFAFLFIVFVVHGFSIDYFPLQTGDYWIYDYSYPKPPETSCSWGDKTMERIDSVFNKDNSKIYVVNSYAVSDVDTCFIDDSCTFYYLDSANYVFLIYDINNLEDRYLIGLHDYNSISTVVDGIDTLYVSFHSTYSRTGKSYNDCYEFRTSDSTIINVYAPDLGLIDCLEEDFWYSLISYNINPSIISVKYKNLNYQKNVSTGYNPALLNQYIDVLGRSVSGSKVNSGAFINNNRLRIFTRSRLNKR